MNKFIKKATAFVLTLSIFLSNVNLVQVMAGDNKNISSIIITSTELVSGTTPLFGNENDLGEWKVRGNGQPIGKATVSALNDRRDPGVPFTEDAKSSEGSTRLLFRVYDQSGVELPVDSYTLSVKNRDTGENLTLRDPDILGDRDKPTIKPEEVKAFTEIDDPVRVYFPGRVPVYTDGEFDDTNPDHEFNLTQWWNGFYTWYDDYEVNYNLLDFNRVGNYTVTATLKEDSSKVCSMDVDAVSIPKGIIITKGDTIDANGYGGGSTVSSWSVPSAGGPVGTTFKIKSVYLQSNPSVNLLDTDLVQLSVVEYDYAKKTPDNPNFDPEIQSITYYTVLEEGHDGSTTPVAYWKNEELDKSLYTLSDDKSEISFKRPGLYKVSASIGEPARGETEPYSLFPDWTRDIKNPTTGGLPISVSESPVMSFEFNGGENKDALGNEIVSPQTLSYANRIMLIEDSDVKSTAYSLQTPVKSGSTFDNWYSDKELKHSLEEKAWHFYDGTITHINPNPPYNILDKRTVHDWQYKPYYHILSDATYYAGWILNKYNVNFDNGAIGTKPDSETVTFEDYLLAPEVFERGYTIEGWYTEPTFENKYDFSKTYDIDSEVVEADGPQKINPYTGEPAIMPNYDSDNIIIRDEDGKPVGDPVYEKTYEGNVTLYAKWEEVDKYTVDFDTDGGSVVPSQNISADWESVARKPAESPTKTDYNFEGWYTDKTYKKLYNFNNPIKGNTVIYAKFTPIPKFNVTFESNGGSDIPVQLVEYNGKAIAPTDPTRLDYIFDGWYTNSDLTTKYDFESTVKNNITLYAKWIDNRKFKVTFNTNGGTIIPEQTVLVNKTVEKPENPTKTDCTFDGWYTDSSFSTEYNFTTPVTKDITLYAKFTPITKYNVTFESNGGTNVSTQSVLENEKATKPEDPTKTDYVFDGWYQDSELTTSYDFETPVTKNITLYAKWIDHRKFKVTFNTDGGTAILEQSVLVNDKVEKPEDPTKTDFIFGGWYTDSSFETLYDFETPVTKDITLYAKFTPIIKYNVTFESNGGTDIQTQTVEENERATRPSNPTKTDYIFVGWYEDSDLTTLYNFDTPVTKNITLYAKWTIEEKVDVVFNTNGGTSVDTQTIVLGNSVTKPSNPTKEGYTFEYWYLDDYNVEYDFTTPVNTNIILNAKWIDNRTFDVIFNTNGGTDVQPQTVDYGKNARKPVEPRKYGFIFAGWYQDIDLTSEFDFTMPIRENKTIYAKWVPIGTVTVTFDTNGGTKIPAQSILKGETITKPSNPTKENSTFNYWYTQDEPKKAFDFATPILENITIYAKFTKNSNSNSDSGGSSISKKPLPSNNDNTNSIITVDFGNNKASDKDEVDVSIIEENPNSSKITESIKQNLVAYNSINEELLEKTLYKVNVEVNDKQINSYNEPVKVTYDLSGFDLDNVNKYDLIGILINDVTGEIEYLGGRYNEKTGVFETQTNSLKGDVAVIVADNKSYDQAIFAIDKTKYGTNGATGTLDASPFIKNSTTYVPLRALSETFGATVEYEAVSKTANITLDTNKVSFTSGKSIDGNPEPLIVNSRMFIPLRYASETLGANVIWYGDDKTIQITK